MWLCILLVTLALFVLLGYIAFIILWVLTRGLSLVVELECYFKWQTIDDLVERGYMKHMCGLLLNALYEENRLEVRVRSDLDEADQWAAQLMEFEQENLDFFEFRVIRRPRRKERFFDGLMLPKPQLQPAWNYGRLH